MNNPASSRKSDPKKGNSRSSARLSAVQALYQMDVGRSGVESLLNDNLAQLPEIDITDLQANAADKVHYRTILNGVVQNQRAIDRQIASLLEEAWPLHRIDSTLRAIFRAASYEFLEKQSVPARVVIAEYVDIAAAFFDEEERKLANGVLDALARFYRADEFTT